ncbi:MAG: class I SAM-dependent DNA methyltransferase [Chloroflexi bacterium]|nr:class I SAM-dependent DNA methyltransferase [Chloroflexota bacterium]
MQAADFVAKWRASQQKESAAYVSHFEDLCRLVGHETPIETDPSGGFFCYQKGVTKESGRQGFADVWLRRHFGWEYKSKGGDLEAAYRQLLQYRDNLENPPLLIVCDFDRIEIRTNFTGTVSRKFTITLDDILSGEPLAGTGLTPFQVLKACFEEPDDLRPKQTTEGLTKDAADRLGAVAESLRAFRKPQYDPVAREYPRYYTDDEIARYLSKLIFCMFASDVGLLPRGIVGRLIDNYGNLAPVFAARMCELFEKMSTGGDFGVDRISYFNGGLFTDTAALEIDSDNLRALRRADELDWTDVEPSIFGTLFERILDPAKRSQLGKHYTSREDIERIVTPVLMWPLEREWEALQKEAAPLQRWDTETGVRRQQHRETLKAKLDGFLDRLGAIKVLDPACGSGNFLYVSLAMLKTLERQVIAYGATWGITGLEPRVHPRQMYGIEINDYAHELSSIVVWIGYLQWKHRNGIPFETEVPVLQKLDNIHLMDAIISLPPSPSSLVPQEPEWPEADVIVGNPPFLGGKRLRTELGDSYVDGMFRLYDGRVRRESDLCCYWFEKARAMVESGKVKRAGLLATQAIRRGANRETLRRIKESGDLFYADSDRPWVLDGAAIRVSMVGFDAGTEARRVLDGQPVEGINADLTSQTDLTRARRLKENLGISFMGDTKVGPFEIDEATASKMLAAPNPHRKPNSDVVRPWVNGLDITRRPRHMWIIDFPPGMTEAEAAFYEAPFLHVSLFVRPMRAVAKSGDATGVPWWIHQRPRPEMRAAFASLDRFLCTSRVSKHRIFIWVPTATLPDSRVYAFARDDDYFAGVLQSRIHDVWSLHTGSTHGDGSTGGRPVYNNTTCFETFPFPRPTPAQEAAIASAAAELNQLRENWLNPPGLAEEELKKRTLTAFYSNPPTWLPYEQRKLDEAVFAAYGWPPTLSDGDILARLLALNLEREAVP